jgi:hypothetical protein
MNLDVVFLETGRNFIISVAFGGVSFHAHKACGLAFLPVGEVANVGLLDIGKAPECFSRPLIGNAGSAKGLFQVRFSEGGISAVWLGADVEQDGDLFVFEDLGKLLRVFIQDSAGFSQGRPIVIPLIFFRQDLVGLQGKDL